MKWGVCQIPAQSPIRSARPTCNIGNAPGPAFAAPGRKADRVCRSNLNRQKHLIGTETAAVNERWVCCTVQRGGRRWWRRSRCTPASCWPSVRWGTTPTTWSGPEIWRWRHVWHNSGTLNLASGRWFVDTRTAPAGMRIRAPKQRPTGHSKRHDDPSLVRMSSSRSIANAPPWNAIALVSIYRIQRGEEGRSAVP